MSNPNFVSDLVAMAKAFEELPQVKAELDAKSHDFSVAQQNIQRLEERIMSLKAELDAAHANTRKVEVERDHAEHMFLEAEDRTEKALAFVRMVQGNAQSLIHAVSPPKPEPIPEPQAESVEGQSAPHPTDASSLGSSPSASQSEPSGERAADPLLNVQSVPITSSDHSDTSGSALDVTSSTVDNGVSVPRDPTQATESSSENVSSVSTQSAEQHSPSINSTTEQSQVSSTGYAQHEEATAAAPVDPTASSMAGDGHSSVTAEALATPADLQADATSPEPAPTAPSGESVDDVGYHNEPRIEGDGEGRWAAWDAWSERMNKRYGTGHWPQRPNIVHIA